MRDAFHSQKLDKNIFHNSQCLYNLEYSLLGDSFALPQPQKQDT